MQNPCEYQNKLDNDNTLHLRTSLNTGNVRVALGQLLEISTLARVLSSIYYRVVLCDAVDRTRGTAKDNWLPRLLCLPRDSLCNRPRSIYQYSNMAPRLSGLTSTFGVVFFVSKSLLRIEGQKKLEKFAILTRKPRSQD